jgi:hypothetical protein
VAGRIRRIAVILGATVALLPLVGVGAIWAHDAADPRLKFQAKLPYLDQRYSAYAQPWGAEQSALWRRWASYGLVNRIAPLRFPAETSFVWRWAPVAPTNDLGVWSYSQVAYGDYEGGDPPEPVPPKRVRDLKSFRQGFSWHRSVFAGDANVLTEFFLRSDPKDPDAKLLEVGWFLHLPDKTARYMTTGRQLGVFTDGQGRRWRVAREGIFCMFAPADGKDVASGTLDMAEALRWLVSKREVTGDAWVTGVAIGAEALGGFGRVDLHRWQAELR